MVKPPNFELKEYTENGIKRKRLIIFSTPERNMCYVFLYNKQRQYFYCGRCSSKKGNMVPRADIVSNINGEHVTLRHNTHVCQPIVYLPDMYEDLIIVKEPDFKIIKHEYRGKLSSKIIVYEAEERGVCHEYIYSNSKKTYYCSSCWSKYKLFITVKLLNTDGEEPCLQLSRKIHQCLHNPVPVIKEEDTMDVTQTYQSNMSRNVKVKSENKKELPPNSNQVEKFEIKTVFRGKTTKQHLILFDENDPNLVYTSCYSDRRKSYICSRCSNLHKKYVWTKVKNAVDGSQYLQHGYQKHVCKPENYQQISRNSNGVRSKPRVAVKREIMDDVKPKIVKHDAFQISTRSRTRALKVFSSPDKTTGYSFYYSSKYSKYICNGCLKLKKNTSAQYYEAAEGNDYVMLFEDHVCQPATFESDLGRTVKMEKEENDRQSSDNIVPQIPSKIGARKKIGTSEPKAVLRVPDFKFEYFRGKNNAQRCRVVVFDSNDRNLCFLYFYDPKTKNYACDECLKLNQLVTVKKCGKNGVHYLQVNHGDHVCKPIPIASSDTIPAPNVKAEPESD